MIGEIKSLHPVFAAVVNQILKDMKTKGWDPVIGSGMRTKEQQDALYSQGRKGLQQVNAARLRVHLPPISASENEKTVTNAKGGQSNHNLTESLLAYSRSALDVANGYAVDIIDRRYGWEIADQKFWRDLGEVAKKYGCAWGGDWKKPDPAHIEMKLIDGAPRHVIPA